MPTPHALVKNVSVTPNLFDTGSITLDILGINVTVTLTCNFTVDVGSPFFTVGTTAGGTEVVPATTLIYDPLSSGTYTYSGTYTGTLDVSLRHGFTVNSVVLSYTDIDTSTLVLNVANLGGNSFPSCFPANTLVQTPRGPVFIQSLKKGDLVTNQNGAAIPIKRIGNWEVTPALIRKSHSCRIYKIPKGKFGARMDVLISYWHKILINGKMVKACNAGLTETNELGFSFTLYNIQLENSESNHMIVGGGVIVESWSGINDFNTTIPIEDI